MSYKLLIETILFEQERHNYTPEEILKIDKDLKERSKKAISKIGNGYIDYINSINTL